MKERLKDRVYSGPSDIHGTGLFAKRKIKKGSYIGTYKGPETRKDGTYVLWIYEEDKEPVGRDGRNLLRYLNHAEDGNAEFDGYDLYARRKIGVHDEVTFDYEGGELS